MQQRATVDSNPLIGLDVSPRRKPGADRGLGRNLEEITGFFERHKRYGAIPVDVALDRFGRWTEFVEIPARFGRLRWRDIDLYHSMSPYHLVPGRGRGTVVSILDLIPLEARLHGSGTGFKANFFFRIARNTTAIITISEYSRSRITERLQVEPERVFVAPLPVAAQFREWTHDVCRLPPALRDRTYFVGMINLRRPDPRKRYPWLLGARNQLAKAGIPVVLVGPGSETIAPVGEGLGRVADDQLAEVLAHARGLLYTSAYEGQGLPPLEAMSLGTPVVAFDNSALPEVIGRGGILLEDGPDAIAMTRANHSEDDDAVRHLVEAALLLASDPATHDRIAAEALAHAKRYNVERFDSSLRNAYDFALAEISS